MFCFYYFLNSSSKKLLVYDLLLFFHIPWFLKTIKFMQINVVYISGAIKTRKLCKNLPRQISVLPMKTCITLSIFCQGIFCPIQRVPVIEYQGRNYCKFVEVIIFVFKEKKNLSLIRKILTSHMKTKELCFCIFCCWEKDKIFCHLTEKKQTNKQWKTL